MNHKRKWLLMAPLFLALVLLAVALWGARPAAAEAAHALGGMVSGVVTAPGSTPLPVGTRVKLFDPSGQTLVGQAQPDLASGAFSLGPVSNGLYVIKAVPPTGSGLTQSLPHPSRCTTHPWMWARWRSPSRKSSGRCTRRMASPLRVPR